MNLAEVLAEWDQGNISRGQLPIELIIAAGNEADLAQALQALSEASVQLIREEALLAPWTEEGWSNMIYVVGGMFGPNYDPEKERRRFVAIFRKGVEAVRVVLKLKAPPLIG